MGRFGRHIFGAAVLGCLGVALGLGSTACGKSGEGAGKGGPIRGDTLTIYSTLPLRGARKGPSEAIVAGQRLALEEAGNKAGKFDIDYVSLDDSATAAGEEASPAGEDGSLAAAGDADPGVTLENARQAAQDETTIAYLGDLGSAASMVSLPILNNEGIAQISSANTYVGLTTSERGSEPGEPQKYYPSGRRTYVRIVPRDTVQGAALAKAMGQEGCWSAHVLHDGGVPGAGLARIVEHSAKKEGLRVAGNEGIDANASDYRSLALGLEADCVVFSGAATASAVRLFRDLAAVRPQARMFGLEGLAHASFTPPRRGGLPADVARRTLVTAPELAPRELPPKAQKLLDRLSRELDDKQPDPHAVYGYEAMKLALDAIERAGPMGNDRRAVVRELFSTRDRKSVLGEYDIDRNGDTSLTDYGLYRIVGGELEFERVIEAKRG